MDSGRLCPRIWAALTHRNIRPHNLLITLLSTRVVGCTFTGHQCVYRANAGKLSKILSGGKKKDHWKPYDYLTGNRNHPVKWIHHAILRQLFGMICLKHETHKPCTFILDRNATRQRLLGAVMLFHNAW